MKIKKCPICSCNRLWFKEYSYLHNITYNVLFKCDNCAYVNTTLNNPSTVSSPFLYHSQDYLSAGVYVCTDGRTAPADYLIGYNYWFKDGKLIHRTVECPFCHREMYFVRANPFIRFKGKNGFRVDVFYTCKKKHAVTFGVHIPS